jgi:hypothetical protein
MRRVGCAVLLPLVLSAAAVGRSSQEPAVSTRAVVRAAAAYVAEYQRQLTSVIADELYTQDIVRQVPREPKAAMSRTMRSEVFFMFAPASRNWMAIRDVVAVDGQALGDRPDLSEALQDLPAREVASTFKSYNSRFNIGRTFRNFNEPTLALLVLDGHHRDRFSFGRHRVDRSGDTVLVTLTFAERESPTLIHDTKRGRVFSKGELVVEAGSGRIRRAVLTAKIAELRVELTTTYSSDDRLGMWVPTHFRERYEYGVAPNLAHDVVSRSEYEHILCEAAYTNYRRFETSVRIK